MNIEIKQVEPDKWVALAESDPRVANLPLVTGKTLDECKQNLAQWERDRVAQGLTPSNPVDGRIKTMIHLEDVVEEVATKRRGRVDNTGGSLVNGQEVTNQWRVHFSDGIDPLMKIFLNEEELRLVTCPHEISEPGFYPSR